MPELSQRAKPIVQAVFDKAYLEQAVGDAPWGVTEDGSCSYKLGCAIGRSLPNEITPRMEGIIERILTSRTSESYYPGVRELLLGTRDVPPKFDADVACYGRIQTAHDATWSNEDRGRYKEMLELVAKHFGLRVPEAKA